VIWQVIAIVSGISGALALAWSAFVNAVRRAGHTEPYPGYTATGIKAALAITLAIAAPGAALIWLASR
jgi:hypothetical protein